MDDAGGVEAALPQSDSGPLAAAEGSGESGQNSSSSSDYTVPDDSIDGSASEGDAEADLLARIAAAMPPPSVTSASNTWEGQSMATSNQGSILEL